MDWPRYSARLKALSPSLLLPLILVVALGLRLYGIDWDQGHGFHPDERSIYMRADCMYDVLTEALGYARGDCVRSNPDMEPGFPSAGAFLDADRSPLNPHWFPLGSILIYLIVAVRFVLEPFTDFESMLSMSSYVGRSIMALADVGTVFMVYLLGKRIYSRRVGLLAASLVALAVVHIQLSHFYRPEPLLVFFLTVSFWFMLQVIEKRRLRDSLLLGLFVGLTLAPKISVLPLVMPLAIAYGFRLFTTSEGRWVVPRSSETTVVVSHALAAAVAAGAAFFITTPYAFLDIVQFVGDQWWQATNVAKTAGKVPFTVQYIGTTPFLYELRQTSLWALGLPLGIVAWGGLLFTMLKVTRINPARKGELLLLAWVVPNFLLVGSFEVKFLRYIFPIIPFLILMGSGMLFWMLDRARSLSGPPPPISGSLARARGFMARYSAHAVVGVMVFVVAATAFYAFAFESVYTRPHTAIQASRWINDNVPRHSTIVTDNHWDEGIPDIYSYTVRQIPIYDPDTQQKMDTIADYLSRGDYLVFYSSRTYGSVARLDERYPLSSRYYRLLFSEKLGYQLEKAFTSYPQLLGVAFVDDTFSRARIPEPEYLSSSSSATLSLNLGYADENVINYDHPKVLLFRNVEGLSMSRLTELLTQGELGEEPQLGLTPSPGKVRPFDGTGGQPYSQINAFPAAGLPEQHDPPELGLMLSPEQKAKQREEGTWSEIIKRDSWTNKLPVLAWLLLVELIYIATLPLAIFLFRPLPDRGIILARVLGILGVAYVAWLLASIGWMGFSRTSVLVGILAVAALSTIVLVARWRELVEFLKGHWRLLAIGEVLFLVAFLSFVAIRMANPDLWEPYLGGEKPMDFAYLNAVLRSSYMPPYDPWFAGGYLNYYYWGQFIVATLIKATGIVPSVAYNLAVPLMFALTVTGAYSLVYNIAEGIRRHRPPTRHVAAPSTEAEPEPPSAAPAGGSGSAAILPWRRWTRGVAWGPVTAGVVASLFVAVIGNLYSIGQVVRGGWNNMFRDAAFPSLDYISSFWYSSRMLPELENVSPSALTFWLPDRLSYTREIGPHITEFPFFTFLFADLHAHLIVIPFTLLAIGLSFSLLVGLRTGGRLWLVPTTAALALTVGSLWAINSWDYPTYVILAVLLIGVGAYLRPGKPLKRLAAFLGLGLGMVFLSILAFLPFHMDYHPFPTGIEVNLWQTPILNFAGIYALFLFLVATFLVYVSRGRLQELLISVPRPSPRVRDVSGFRDAGVTTMIGLKLISWTAIAGAVTVAILIYMAATGYWTAALLTLLLALTLWAAKGVLAAKGEGAPYAIVPLALIALGLAIAIGVEFVRSKDDIGRMNTLFKYYLEVWILLSIASAFILWYLASRIAFKPREVSPTRVLCVFMLAVFVVIVIAIVVEFSKVNGDVGSMNMLFKYHLIVWVLFGISLAYIVWYVVSRGSFRLREMYLLSRGVWLVMLVLLLAASFINTGLVTRSRLADRFNTGNMSLDGAAYMKTAVYSKEGATIEFRWDYGAIRWLQDNVKGSPVVLEAHNVFYTWSSRIADYTGLPTVLGWPWHQTQQRMEYQNRKYGYPVSTRGSHVRELYTTLNLERTLELLKLYKVEYVVVGQLERAYYPADGLHKFEKMAQEGLAQVVYENEGIKVYRGQWYNQPLTSSPVPGQRE